MSAAETARCRLFVYGSLKRGQPNHEQLGQARFIDVARTAPCFALRLIDGYPALVPGMRSIVGQLFEVTFADLERLDDFEGAGYLRVRIELEGGLTAFAYLSRTPARGEPHDADEWLA